MKYKVIGFDYSGVITESSGSDFTLNTCKILNIDKETFFDVYLNHNHLLNTTDIDSKDFWKILLKKWDRENKEKEFFEFLKLSKSSDNKFNYELLDFIKELKNFGYKIALLSNNTSKLNKTLIEAGIDILFDLILISGDVGCMKPSVEIFQMLCGRLEIDPKELIFVDDFNKNFINAEKVGFTPVLFNNNKELKDKFKELNII